MAEQVATLEFSVHTQRGFQSGFLPGLTADQAAEVRRVIHFREVVADHLDPLPLCWVADGKQRGATVEEWEISFDHEALPTFAVIDVKSFVTCDDCKEWLHA